MGPELPLGVHSPFNAGDVRRELAHHRDGEGGRNLFLSYASFRNSSGNRGPFVSAKGPRLPGRTPATIMAIVSER